jgi:hypothetical protein
MGLNTALYRGSLLSIDSVDRPSSQWVCLAFRFICFLLDLLRFAYVSILQRCMPWYSTSLFLGRLTLPM